MQTLQKPKQGYKLVKSSFGKYEEIPEEWDVKQISEIGNIVGGGTPDSENKEYWNGNVLWAVPTDITRLKDIFIENTERSITQEGLDNSSAKLLPEGTVLITSRATIGECAINTVPIATNQGFQSLICNAENDNVFMFYAIKFYKNRLLRLSYGTTFPEISKNNIRQVRFPCPPLMEQKKISLILSKVDELIQKTVQIIEQTQRLKKGLSQKLFTKGIGHTRFKKTDIGGIPEEWDIEPVQELSIVVTIGVVNPATPYYTSKDKGIPYFRTQNIRKNYLNESNLVFVLPEFNKKHKKSTLKENDVLTVQTGEIGISCLVPKKYEGCNCHSLLLTRPDPQKLDFRYFCQFLNSDFGNMVVSRFGLNTGRGHLLLEDFRLLKVPKPPISEQYNIGAILSNIDKLIEKHQRIKSKLDRTKKGLMQKLLIGNIRVAI